MAETTASDSLKRTPLYALHVELGGKIVPFAGYEMPVQFPMGILNEHLHTRRAVGLFDVSHMGQVRLTAKPGKSAAAAIERLVPGDIAGLKPGQMRYTQLTNGQGGILDDFMVTSTGDHLLMVFNAACKDADLAHVRQHLSDDVEIEPMFARGLLALQGPEAVDVLGRHAPQVRAMTFMTGSFVVIDGAECYVTRSGYTGCDGYEISTPGDAAERIARLLLKDDRVKPIGLGARDSLRLEAGLCLYGHDIDTTTTPVEAGLTWSIGKERRAKGGFPGDEIIIRQIASGPPRRRVGLRPEGRTIAREGTEIVDASGAVVGKVTSGGFGPSLNGPLAMGYVERAHAAAGTKLALLVRGKPAPAEIVAMPFVKHTYWRG
ncbi:glycine cleavage system aminomethyltransferase GcvT [Reyranella sp. CPCC 100927]|uniref:glycine cleavage system aminomethyltransferase GcvT n=1 Tax=Reyranella sp. CPCC 100927 TaxID=2599616 RepID=UPI0011B55733|nr:glycine cleavage system aminomethyltransferase GcvT [Reyranella sp. CPCC 100927]TWS97093.1 glycine cleavage system aminomethyltransferase GcvT [Reyranella sp. CPCC 100927]